MTDNQQIKIERYLFFRLDISTDRWFDMCDININLISLSKQNLHKTVVIADSANLIKLESMLPVPLIKEQADSLCHCIKLLYTYTDLRIVPQ
jgi:hypothetical protein